MKMVNKPRKSLVAVALAAVVGSAALMSAPVQAANIAQDGIGQVLLFPYYTVNNGWDSYVHLTNTSTTQTVLAKIRFREAKNSREVRDFNIILSPNDQWTGAVTVDGDGAKLVSYDTTCTSPMLPVVDAATGRKEVGFTSIGYDGTDQFFYDNGGEGIERTQEGYLEVITMAVSSESTSLSTNVIEYNAKHVAGTPRDCAVVDASFLVGDDTSNLSALGNFTTFTAPENVLKGFSTLINVASGQAVGVEPTVVANFQNTDPIIFQPGSLFPNLGDGDVNYAFFDDALNVPVAGAAAASEDAVSTLLQRRYVVNEFSTAAVSNVKTDWVVTFPTKYNYVDDGGFADTAGLPLNSAAAPFSEWFADAGKSCVSIQLDLYGREEQQQMQSSSTVFSPRPSGPSGAQLCNEVNVLTFNGSNVLGSSVLAYDINTGAVGNAGFGRLRLGAATVDEEVLSGYEGLPVIGFSLMTRNNASEAGNNRNYSTAQQHSFERVAVAP